VGETRQLFEWLDDKGSPGRFGSQLHHWGPAKKTTTLTELAFGESG